MFQAILVVKTICADVLNAVKWYILDSPSTLRQVHHTDHALFKIECKKAFAD